MGPPALLSSGDWGIIGDGAGAVTEHEAEKYLAKKGARKIAVKVAGVLIGQVFGVVTTVLDPTHLGDGTRIGNTRGHNAVKIKEINDALDKRR